MSYCLMSVHRLVLATSPLALSRSFRMQFFVSVISRVSVFCSRFVRLHLDILIILSRREEANLPKEKKQGPHVRVRSLFSVSRTSASHIF